MTRHTTLICIGTILMLVLMPLSARGEQNETAHAEELQTLIRKVEENEAFYDDLKLNLTSTKSDVNPLFAIDVPKPIVCETQIMLDVQELKFRQEDQSKGRFIVITQGGLGWLNQKKDPANANYTNIGTKTWITVCDAKTSRYFWTDDVVAEKRGQQRKKSSKGGISDKPMPLPNLARPHMFLLENVGLKIPLSTYLKGAKAIRSYPGPSQLRKGTKLKVQILGSEACQGLLCTKISIEYIDPKGTPRSRREFWLAQDRNLTPVRNLSYTYRDSKEMPIAEAIIDEWQEVSPGVWFPRQAHYNRFGSMTVKREGRQELSWHVTYDVNRVQLEPQFSPEVFTTLKFPPGTKVTLVKDGKIIKTIDVEANEL
ncbi:hypothetical protein [uncultured Gimesia sp.]|uniref:hypothetical protein n=1 Tax=uncultured Gimesia sp. TaxID=1678688 RepID=UPI0030D80710